MNITGIIIGGTVFLLIGVFHPIVIKVEYHFGKKAWWVFALIGCLALGGSLIVENNEVSSIIGAFGITCFWTIKELFEQEERVRKGWYPKKKRATENI